MFLPGMSAKSGVSDSISLDCSKPSMKQGGKFVIPKDVAAINRMFLLNAQKLAQAGQYGLGHIVTGLPEAVLKLLAVTSLEEIDRISTTLPVTVFTMRLDETELRQVMNTPSALAGALSVTHLALSSR